MSANVTAEVELRYDFPSTPHTEFSDTLLLSLIDTDGYGIPHWRIDNIRYEDGSDLVTQLVRIFNEEGA